MEFIYNKSAIGYSHIAKGTVCQDYSDSYINDKYHIITACDGHGGKIYIRSDRGAKFASQAVIDVITSYSVRKLNSLIEKKSLDKLKLEILCKWNDLVEQDYINEEFTLDELRDLTEDERFKLQLNYIKAYGTTLNAIVSTKKYLICIQIGDGGMFLIKNKKVEVAFEENNENVANITNSLCGDDAYDDLFIKAVKKDKYSGALICTDGVIGPYQTYINFFNSFINPFINNFKTISIKKVFEMDDFIELLGSKIGNGDDVSVAAMLYTG